MPVRVGDTASHRFVLDDESMRLFQDLSGDHSRIHTDDAYARARGYKGVIAYGGIMLAHLSYLLGSKLPGTDATSTKWTINYREPLYVGEEAEVHLTVSTVSKANGVVEGKFRITCEARTIATGTTQSIVPPDQIAD
jgi:3-hydroxybutyryl-CoA dehydratase